MTGRHGPHGSHWDGHDRVASWRLSYCTPSWICAGAEQCTLACSVVRRLTLRETQTFELSTRSATTVCWLKRTDPSPCSRPLTVHACACTCTQIHTIPCRRLFLFYSLRTVAAASVAAVAAITAPAAAAAVLFFLCRVCREAVCGPHNKAQAWTGAKQVPNMANLAG